MFSNKKKVLIYLFALIFLTGGIVYVVTAEKTMQKQRTELQDAQIGLEEIEQMAEEILDASENTFILTQEELKAIQEEKNKLEAEIVDLKFSLSNDEDAFGLYRDRIVALLKQLSEKNNAPVTADSSSPWEQLVAFKEATNNKDYSRVHALLSRKFKDGCTEERFIEISKEKNPLAPPIGFLDQAIGETFAVVYHTTGFEWSETMSTFFAEDGQWVIRLNPIICE